MQTEFSQDVYEGKYLKEDTNVGVFASKLQYITGQYMFRYLNQLISILLRIPRITGKKAFEEHNNIKENKDK